MKKIALAALLIAAGCRAQVPPPTNHVVNLTWTAPVANSTWTGCTTSAPCVYAVYRCSASAATCANTSNTAWQEITTTSTRPSGTAYTDATANGLTAYYVVVTVQGSASSGPSNTAGPLVVPGVPVAPALGVGSVAQNNPPLIAIPSSEPTMAMAMNLKAHVR